MNGKEKNYKVFCTEYIIQKRFEGCQYTDYGKNQRISAPNGPFQDAKRARILLRAHCFCVFMYFTSDSYSKYLSQLFQPAR